MNKGDKYLQKFFQRAIRKRQRNYPECLNPKDIKLILNRAIKTILKENKLK